MVSPAAHIRHSGGVSDGRHWRAAAPEEGRVGGPELTRRATGARKDTDLGDGQPISERSRRTLESPAPVWEEDEEYYELSPEPEFERDASPYLSSEAEPIPDLEPTMGSYPAPEREEEEEPDIEIDPDLDADLEVDPDREPSAEAEHEPEVKASSEPADELYPEHDAEEEGYPEHEQDAEHEAVPDCERFGDDVEDDVRFGSPPAQGQLAEDCKDAGASLDQDDQAQDACNVVDQVVTMPALDDEPRSDASDGSRAKLTQMKVTL
ncbi:protein TsetseEP-like [Pollicipes pollicipes]|uniref:protein TsetseEP-like n=1 Tax=Pollicipes pollicipes TaxID=41117 RepID=UPI0018850CAF|nr:protein TsetseEP-like [Pollicipes pollicipes]